MLWSSAGVPGSTKAENSGTEFEAEAEAEAEKWPWSTCHTPAPVKSTIRMNRA